MKRKTAIIFASLIVVLLLLGIFIVCSYYSFLEKQDSYNINETFTIANWNMQVFGEKKANDTELMDKYSSIISNFDIIFVQEIRDKDGYAFMKLCAMLPAYNCNVSSRAGRTSSKEQYGIIYLKNITLENMIDYNPDIQDRWERPPIRADFSVGNYSFSAYNIHTKPEDTPNELIKLEQLVIHENNSRNVVLLGDFNADCGYFDRSKVDVFHDWSWIISDTEDTTVHTSDCAYDRIIMNNDAFDEYTLHGIYKSGIDESMSDHYPVWVRMRDYEYKKDASFNAYWKYTFK